MMSHSPGESGGDEAATIDSKRAGKRELSTSKRAAQNRQAQVCLLTTHLSAFVPLLSLPGITNSSIIYIEADQDSSAV